MTLNETILYISIDIAVLGFIAGRMSVSKTEGERDGTLMTEVGYIKSSTDDIKKQLREQEQKHIEVVTRLSAVEQSAKQAHHRIDEIREHCCGD